MDHNNVRGSNNPNQTEPRPAQETSASLEVLQDFMHEKHFIEGLTELKCQSEQITTKIYYCIIILCNVIS